MRLYYLASEKAIELGSAMLPNGYDDTLDSLDENLYCISIMNNLNPPQLTQ
ncbi:hypothetical protein [Paramaledivibacter caminithermalis]|uniref:hypothetical protein n=1 Tax=Paramaledivibacter caminithermalis TaxID=191027 RepID=UPI0013F4D2B6|nr:hypothetical protein [Paramaledivibacter caminithermalis]